MNYIKPDVEEISENVHKLTFNTGSVIYIIGTAHVSADSAQLVEDKIKEIIPDTVLIELDEQRYESIINKTKYENVDIFQIIKKNQLFFFIGQFILSSFQKKISEKTGSKPGDEFIRTIKLSEESGFNLNLIDRNIGVTLKRAWRLTPLKDKFKFLGSLFFTENEDFQNIDIEELKKKDAIDALVKSFSEELPAAKKVLIDERDLYLAHGIQNRSGKVTIVVVGAGHVSGIIDNLSFPIPDKIKNDLNCIPPKTFTGKILPWSIPFLIFILFFWGFLSGRGDVAKEFAFIWIIAHGALTVLGCVLSLAHPFTIISGFIAAPLTSLNPAIGAGMVTALVQAIFVKPRISDFEQLNGNSMRIRDWWKNRITRIFLVFLFSSIGSSIGTFAAMPVLIKFFR